MNDDYPLDAGDMMASDLHYAEHQVYELTEANKRLRAEVARLREGWNTLNELYRKHHECFGCDEENDLEAQCEFEDELCKLLCNALGHVYGPDQCGKPEHDYCYRCKKLRINDIG